MCNRLTKLSVTMWYTFFGIFDDTSLWILPKTHDPSLCDAPDEICYVDILLRWEFILWFVSALNPLDGISSEAMSDSDMLRLGACLAAVCVIFSPFRSWPCHATFLYLDITIGQMGLKSVESLADFIGSFFWTWEQKSSFITQFLVTSRQ